MIVIKLLTKNLNRQIHHARFMPHGEEWFIQRNEKGEVCSFRKSYSIARTGHTRQEALDRVVDYLRAATMSKRCIVKLLTNKNKIKTINSCGVDEEDINHFFLKKKTVREVISIEWIY